MTKKAEVTSIMLIVELSTPNSDGIKANSLNSGMVLYGYNK
tara:strand:- start:681 stop:803 length:123 start_codon:yes stop_codon:yes gene_type:complete